MLLLSVLSALAAEPVLAVAPFAVNTTDAELAPFGSALTDMMLTDLHVDGVVLVERGRLDAVLAELKLQQTDFVDPASAQELGKVLGAGWLVTGSLSTDGDQARLDARALDVATGEVLASVSAQGPRHTLFALERQLALSLLDALNIEVDAAHRTLLGGGAPPRSAVGRGFDPDGVALTVSRQGVFAGGTLWVDGVSQGKLKKAAVTVQLTPGRHELAIGTADASDLFCFGAVDVRAPRELGSRDLCQTVEPGYGSFGTVRVGGILALRDGSTRDEKLAVSVSGAGYVSRHANLNLPAGGYTVEVIEKIETESDKGAPRVERRSVCAISADVEEGAVTVVSFSAQNCEAAKRLTVPD
ncbi:MAG: hypothetical protein EP330_02925 [Deltaproteobacteria bacterium]|nr:MAG: hypothetical protein EP330_02925 [Deltaproteobacteria bacterium]